MENRIRGTAEPPRWNYCSGGWTRMHNVIRFRLKLAFPGL